MSVVDAYHAQVRSRVDDAVTAHGYRRSGGREDWHLLGPSGDHGTISVQRNRLDPDRVAFRVHLAVTSGPWWDSVVCRSTGPPPPPRTTHGLWRQVLTPTTDDIEHRGERWWLIDGRDHDSARRCGEDATHGIVNYALPQLDRLLHRPTLLDHVERNDLGRRRPYNGLLPDLLVLYADEGAVESFAITAAALRNPVSKNDHLLEWAERRLRSRAAGPIAGT